MTDPGGEALHAAFLRGINLGRRRLTNDRLRSVVEDFGLRDVDTFIASGNVVFRHDGADRAGLALELEAHLLQALGFPVATFVRPFFRLASLATDHEVEAAEDDGFTPHVLFVRSSDTGSQGAAQLQALAGGDDRFLPRGAEVIWLRRGRLSDAPALAAVLDRTFGGGEHTMRKLNTLRRMVAKFGDR